MKEEQLPVSSGRTLDGGDEAVQETFLQLHFEQHLLKVAGQLAARRLPHKDCKLAEQSVEESEARDFQQDVSLKIDTEASRRRTVDEETS